MWTSIPAAAMGTREDHDGGDRQGKGDDDQHQEEGRIPGAHRNGEQGDRDKGDRHASPGRAQAS